MSAAEVVATAQPIRRPPVVSTRFLRSELGMVFRRRRNLAILAVLAGIPIVIAIAIKVTAPPNDGTDGPPFLFSITGNGIFVALTALTVVLPLFLPLAVSVVSGHIRGFTNTLPLHVEILYNEYQFQAAFAVASLLAFLALITLLLKTVVEYRTKQTRAVETRI